MITRKTRLWRGVKIKYLYCSCTSSVFFFKFILSVSQKRHIAKFVTSIEGTIYFLCFHSAQCPLLLTIYEVPQGSGSSEVCQVFFNTTTPRRTTRRDRRYRCASYWLPNRHSQQVISLYLYLYQIAKSPRFYMFFTCRALSCYEAALVVQGATSDIET